MTSEIIREMNVNFYKMRALILDQKFKVSDAQKFCERYYNFIRAIEGLEESRNKWREKCKKLQEKTK